MPKYRGFKNGAAPLRLQLTADTGESAVRIVELSATGETATGSAARPTVTRPFTIGTGAGVMTPEKLDPLSADSTATLKSAFNILPSVPPTVTGTFNLPIRVRWVAPSPAEGLYLLNGGALLFYANCVAPHKWSGEMTWEEL